MKTVNKTSLQSTNELADLLQKADKEIQQLKNALTEKDNKINEWQSKYQRVLEQFKLFQQHRFSPSSEKNPDQGNLFDEALLPNEKLPDEDEHNTIIVSAHKRKQKPKRPKLPEHFPREVVIHDIDEADKTCECGCQKECFAKSITEQLEVIPPQFKVIQHVRPKYVCKRCQGNISIATQPPLLLPKSIAAPSLVAYTAVAKYCDHLPLHRQEGIWRRYRVRLPRNTSCNWLLKTADTCQPLIDVAKDMLLSIGYIQADESPLQVLQTPGKSNHSQSYMWLYRGNAPNKTIVIYEYQPTRAGKHARDFLQDYRGYLQTDAYKGYDWVRDNPAIHHLGCMAHGRRPFIQLVKLAKQPGLAHEAIEFFKSLYAIETQAREQQLSYEQRYQLRLDKAKPILNAFYIWLMTYQGKTPKQNTLGKAIQYMIGHWDKLTAYLLDGRLEIDNNWVENDVRPFALGKHNWLFAGSPRGAKAGATFYSLIMTAKANHIEPFDYLNYIFNRIPLCKTYDDYRQLLPFNISDSELPRIS